jgi:acetyl-CoA carboxylase biotin carboxylase subunit
MLAKLIVHGRTRDQAIARMHRALLELTVEGVETSRDFHLRVMENDDFRRGDISIQWLERHMNEIVHAPPPPGRVRLAAIAAALIAQQDRGQRGGPEPATGDAAPATASTRTQPGADAWRQAARLEGLR